MGSALILLAAAPIQWFSWIAGTALERLAHMGEELHQRVEPPTQQQAADLVAACVPCCGGIAGNIAFTVLLMAPVVAGATMLGAEAAAGRARLGTLLAGFRRYLATVWIGALCLILGGGVAVIAGAVASVGARMGLTAASELTAEVGGQGAQLALWLLAAATVAGMVWLSARLWLALYRLVDPDRPRETVRACLRWSWARTAGGTQWRIAGFMLALGVLAGALQIPGEWLAASEDSARRAAGWGVSGALALFVWLPYVLAASGALYERLSPPVPPVRSPAPPRC